MKARTIKTIDDRAKAISALMRIDLPYVVTIGPEKVRSEAANARYWATLDEHLAQIRSAIERISDETGYRPIEVRKLLAMELSPENLPILYAFKSEAVHEALKIACDVPTSTKLGTKQFQKFEQIMEATLAEVLGDVLAFERVI